jgi:hypothetical protein
MLHKVSKLSILLQLQQGSWPIVCSHKNQARTADKLAEVMEPAISGCEESTAGSGVQARARASASDSHLHKMHLMTVRLVNIFPQMKDHMLSCACTKERCAVASQQIVISKNTQTSRDVPQTGHENCLIIYSRYSFIFIHAAQN